MLNLEAAAQPLILALSWLLATLAVRGRARAVGFPHAVIGDLSWWLAVGALVGARLTYVVSHLSAFLAFPQDVLLTIWHGLSFYGGLGGAILFGVWYARHHELSAWALARAVAPALPLGIALARLGFFGHEIWALRASGGGMPISGTANLLEAMICLGMFVSTSSPMRRGAPSPFLMVLIGYGLVRAMVDLLRPSGAGSWLLSDQALSLGLALVATAVLLAVHNSRHVEDRAGREVSFPSSQSPETE